MTRTNVFATPEEAAECKRLAEEAQRTPVIAMSSADALNGRDWASLAWKEVHETVYKYALAHGLPEIQGYYGMDTSNGEFVTT